MLSAREMAGFRRALLQAWLFLQGRDKLSSSPQIPTPANVCSAGNATAGDGTPPEEEEEDGVKEDEEKKGEEN